MSCPQYIDVDTAERYAAGALPEPDRTAFEDHFFACTACLAEVQALQDAQVVLGRAAPATMRPVVRWQPPVWAGLAAAAVLVLVVATWRHSTLEPSATAPRSATPTGERQSTQAAPASTAPSSPAQAATGQPRPAPPSAAPDRPSRHLLLAQLAVVVPPRYVPLTTRGTKASADDPFTRAMAHYAAGRHPQAAQALRAIAAERPPAADVRFFLGITELMGGRTAEAREALEQVAARAIQPYADEAHFYLAKAAIKEGDLVGARRELEIAVEREAGPEGEAARLLNRLRELD